VGSPHGGGGDAGWLTPRSPPGRLTAGRAPSGCGEGPFEEHGDEPGAGDAEPGGEIVESVAFGVGQVQLALGGVGHPDPAAAGPHVGGV